MKIKKMLCSQTFYLRLLAAVTLVMSFIPVCNPIVDYSTKIRGPLVTVFNDMSSLIKYFSEQMMGFRAYSGMLFILCIFIYVGLVGVLFGLLLTFSRDAAYRAHGRNSIFYSTIVLSVVFVTLCIMYHNIHLDMQQQLISTDGNVEKPFVILGVPVALIVFTLICLAMVVLSLLIRGFSLSAIRYKIRSYFATRFKGGIHVSHNKVTRKMAIEKLPPSKIMTYPLSQHIGAACTPLVQPGDTVKIGQKIADTDAFVSAPIHSSVSGKVLKVDLCPHPTLNMAPAIVIENDFEDAEHESLHNKHPEYDDLTTEQLIAIIREAGITGMGGASFPTHVKIQSALKDNVDTLIVNAAECEPYLSSDNRIMLENTDEVLQGIKILRKILGVKHVYIGIESNKPRAIKVLTKLVSKKSIKIAVLHAKYPQGGEKQLIKAVCDRVVPSGKLPSAVGCCIFNVDTVAAIYRAVCQGFPVMRKIVTVAGDGIEQPANLHVRIGTPFSAVLEHCGLKENTKKIVMGGPMMGIAQYSLDAPVIKGTSGLLAFTKNEVVGDKDASCIRCGGCVSVCPMNLVPNYIATYTKQRDFDMCEKLNAADCIECGCCSYTCPAKIPLVQYMRLSKQNIIEKRKREAKQ